MNPSQRLWSRLKEKHLVALLTAERVEDCLVAFEAFDPLGVVLEITLRTPAALDGIRAVRQKHPDALLLAGTVMSKEQAEAVIAAGVAGVVSADYVPEVVAVCARNDVICVPGGLSDAGKQLSQKAEAYGVGLFELRRAAGVSPNDEGVHVFRAVRRLGTALDYGYVVALFIKGLRDVISHLASTRNHRIHALESNIAYI